MLKEYRLVTRLAILGIMAGLLVGTAHPVHGAALTWWLVGSTIKVPSLEMPPADPTQPLHLHAGRLEYAPFQAVFQSDDPSGTQVALQASYPTQHFDVKIYREQYFPLLQPSPQPGMFSL